MPVHVFSSFTYSYLNRARVLAQSVKRHHPDWITWAVITDEEPNGFALEPSQNGFDRVLTFHDLFGSEMSPWLFGHDIVEACTAVKGRALQYLLKEVKAEKVIYFDPDIAVFNSIAPVEEMLETYSIVLTPHQVSPDTTPLAIVDNEICSLQYGSFNLGFLAVRNDPNALAFADWWDERLLTWCHDRLDIGVFVDQKWCNLVPCFFDNVKILRDPGYNVASWNLSQRRLSIDQNGDIFAAGSKLRFFHFTKLGPVGDAMTKRYANDNMEVFEIWWWYRNEVVAATDLRIPNRWWYYATFEDGQEIPSKSRVLYRSREDLKAAFPNPWASGEGSFQEWLTHNAHELQA